MKNSYPKLIKTQQADEQSNLKMGKRPKHTPDQRRHKNG